MNAGGVDKACKSNDPCIYTRVVANGVVTRGNVPRSREQPVERQANTRWSRKGKDLSLLEQPAGYQLVGSVTDYQGYDA